MAFRINGSKPGTVNHNGNDVNYVTFNQTVIVWQKPLRIEPDVVRLGNEAGVTATIKIISTENWILI